MNDIKTVEYSYEYGVKWIAAHVEGVKWIAHRLAVRMLADMFDVDPTQVAVDVIAEKERIS